MKHSLWIYIIKVLADCQATYNEAERALQEAMLHVKQSRELKEYDSYADYFKGERSLDCGDEKLAAVF